MQLDNLQKQQVQHIKEANLYMEEEIRESYSRDKTT